MTAFALKILAIVTMTLDHIDTVLGQRGLMTLFSLSETVALHLGDLMTVLGRLAFPIFAFCIAEGAKKTRSMPKYIGRLALFAVISEPIYFAVHSRSFGMEISVADFVEFVLVRQNYSNVLFTLTLGALALYGYQLLVRKQIPHPKLWFIPIGVAAAFAAEYFGCNYGIAGVVLILGLYFAGNNTQRAILIVAWSLYLYIIYQGMGAWNQVWTRPILKFLAASASAIPICLYNGKQGKKLKWTFYLYYPAHLLVLLLLRQWLV